MKQEVPANGLPQRSVYSANGPFDHPPLTLTHFVPFPIVLSLACNFLESVCRLLCTHSVNLEYFGEVFYQSMNIAIPKHFFLVDLLELIQIDLLHSF